MYATSRIISFFVYNLRTMITNLESDLPFANEGPQNPVNVVACQVDARGLNFDQGLIQRFREDGVRAAMRVWIGEVKNGLVTVSFGFDSPKDMRAMREVLRHATVACSQPIISANPPVDALTHYDVAALPPVATPVALSSASPAIDAPGGQVEKEPLHLGALVRCEVDARLFTNPDQIVDLLRKAGVQNVLHVYELGADNGTIQLMIATHRPQAVRVITEALKTIPIALLDHGSIMPLTSIPEGARLHTISMPESHHAAHHAPRTGVADTVAA